MQDIIHRKFLHGSPNFLISESSTTNTISNIFMGLCNDNEEVRWNHSKLDNYLESKQVSPKNLVNPDYMSRAIVFRKKEFYSCKALAYSMSQYPDEAKNFIKTDKIQKWLSNFKSQAKTAELVVSVNYIGPRSHSFSDEEKLIKVLLVLDPTGPIRSRTITFMPDGFATELLIAFNTNNSENLHSLIGFFTSGLSAFYSEALENLPYSHINRKINFISDKISLMKSSDPGFGIERAVYDLNPYLTCQTLFLKQCYCIGLADAVNFIDKNNISYKDIASKKNCTSFLAAKLNGNHSFRIMKLEQVSSLFKNRVLQNVNILAQCQQKTKLNQLPNILKNVKDEICELIDENCMSVSIKKRIFDNIINAEKTGSLFEILKAATPVDLIQQDDEGYSNALRRGAELSFKIFSFNNRDNVNSLIRSKSLSLAIKLSYVLCSFLFIIILLKNVAS